MERRDTSSKIWGLDFGKSGTLATMKNIWLLNRWELKACLKGWFYSENLNIPKKVTIFADCPQNVTIWLRQRSSRFLGDSGLPKFYTTSNLNFMRSNDGLDNSTSLITLKTESESQTLRNTPEDRVSYFLHA